MSAYTRNLTITAPEAGLAALERAAEKFNTATEDVTLATMTAVMLAGAPLVVLLFILALPVVGLGTIACLGMKAVRKYRELTAQSGC